MYAAGWKISCVWVMEKVKPTKKGNQSYHYWLAAWRERAERCGM